MNGVELRAKRLFNADTRRSYIVAIDHGLSMGAKPGAEDAIAAVEPSMASEPDGVLIAPGLLARAAHLFGRRGAASPIVRADFLNSGPLLERYGDLHRVICRPREAAALGGDAIIMYLVFGVADGETFVDNLTAIGRTAVRSIVHRQAHGRARGNEATATRNGASPRLATPSSLRPRKGESHG
jgi:class I fructose-bisphosphate aldolase